MEAHELATQLNGSPYRDFAPKNIPEGLVVVYPCSDDLLEFRGAIHDEVSAGSKEMIPLDKNGLIRRRCEDEDCPYEQERINNAPWHIIATHSGKDGWKVLTNIPRKGDCWFDIVEDGELFSKGFVFHMSDLQSVVSITF